jgi:hypothetical protein
MGHTIFYGAYNILWGIQYFMGHTIFWSNITEQEHINLFIPPEFNFRRKLLTLIMK